MKEKKSSIETLAQINSLEEKILILSKKYNDLWVAIPSFVLTPAVLYMLFLHEYSPFYDFYIQEIREQKELDEKRYIEGIPLINHELSKIKNVIMQIGEEEDYRRRFGSNNDIKMIMLNIEILIKENPDLYSYLISHIKKSLYYIYWVTATAWSSMTVNAEHLQQNVKSNAKALEVKEMLNKGLSDPGFDAAFDHSLINLWDNAHKIKNEYDELNKNLLKGNNFYNVFNPKSAVFYHKIFIGFGLYGLLRYGVNRYYPYGVFQSSPPEKPLELSHEKTKNYLTELQSYHKQLTVKVQRNAKIVRYFIPIILFLAIYFYQQAQLNPQLFVIAISLFNIASTGLYRQSKEAYHAWTFNKNISYAEKNLYSMLKDFCSQFILQKETTIESSYFIISFNKKNTLSSKTLKRIFIQCCHFYKLDLLAQRNNSVAISADKLLDCKRLNSIKELFNNNIQREESINFLKDQLNELVVAFKARGLNLYMNLKPNYDHHHLMYLQIELLLIEFHKIPDLQANNLENLLKELFPNFSGKFDRTGEALQISLEGFEFKSLKNLKQIINAIRLIPAVKQEAIDFYQESIGESSEHKKLKPSKAATQKDQVKPIPSQELDRRVIKFGSYTYDSQNPGNIKPVLFMRQPVSEASYKTARIFITSNIDPNKIPKEVQNSLESVLDQPKFVPAKSAQGLVYYRNVVKDDLTGKSRQVDVKIKLLGHANGIGDTRVFGKFLKASTGESLIVVDTVQFHAH